MATSTSSSSSSTKDDGTPSDEEMRKLLKPNPSAEEVIKVIRQSYAPKDGQVIKLVKELESYDDKNFWIEIDGTPYLAKVHNGVESKDLIQRSSSSSSSTSSTDDYKNSAIHLQNAMMEHLSQHGISTSKPQVSVVNGDNIPPTPGCIHPLPVVSTDHSPCDLVVRLLGWVPGRTMESFKMLPLETLADAGRFLGRFSQTMSKLPTDGLSAAKRFHQWDGKNTTDLTSFVSCITDDRRRSMVESIIETFQKEIIDTKDFESFQTSLIHGDFNDANILLDHDGCVSGVIDFGDSVESWRILDLTVAMAYAMLTVYGKRNRAISAAAAFLRGYNSICSISDEERKHLVLLVACRLCCSVTLGAYSYRQNPENEYLLLHATPAWDTLELIWGTDRTRRQEIHTILNDIFEQACTVTQPMKQKGEGHDDDDVFDCSDLSFPDPSLPDPLASMRPVKRTKNS